MPNFWKSFDQLLPKDPLLVGEVLSHNGDGTSTIELPDGGLLRVRGQSVGVGLNAFAQGSQVIGQAPTLPTFTVDV